MSDARYVPIRAIPYVRLLRRVFTGPGTIESVACHKQIIWPRETVRAKPAICLPGQIDRIIDRAADSPSPNAKEIAQVTSATLTHGPTVAYHIKNATLVNGCIYRKNLKYLISEVSRTKISDRSVRLKTGALVSSYLGTKFFGHWLADDSSRHLLADHMGLPAIGVRGRRYHHQTQYQHIFGQPWNLIDAANIEDLFVFCDYSQNRHKRQRYASLRKRIKGQFKSESGERLVYLRRGRTGVPRLIQNEDEILDYLTKHGFSVIDIERDPLDRIVSTLLSARIVLSLGGSHVAHCIYAVPENSGLIVMQPPNRFSAIYRDWAECTGFRFGYTVGAVAEQGYYFSLRDIAATVDLMVNTLSREHTRDMEDRIAAA
jgi:capsular polysaccharide biosynthesis protein